MKKLWFDKKNSVWVNNFEKDMQCNAKIKCRKENTKFKQHKETSLNKKKIDCRERKL